ncbi:hypothetical protein [Spirosoma panaciterrae]|uniref:hypothetical protein n=1 Tax=Spirosoma panaciterrae TaxID=496058 RepID=UPI000377C20B|nr:hypothetical protein [Spirosoma panaciterrae]
MKQIHIASILLYWLLSLLLNGVGLAQSADVLRPDLTILTRNSQTVVNRTATALIEGTYKGIRLDEKTDEGVAWIPDLRLDKGTLEFDVRGKNVLQQSFVGIAFHGQDNKTYEAIYFRPFNFFSTDSLRRVHAVQYIAHPMFTWQKLRTNFPGKYESALSSPPDPNGWFHVRVEIQSHAVRVFVNQNTTPALVVERLVQTANGRVGLWVGNGSGGDFANLTVRPVQF